MSSSSPQPDNKSRLSKQAGVTIRAIRREELEVADKIFRLSFGTFLKLPDPMAFMGDADYVRTRWLADPAAALGAEIGGELVGANLATRWGSVGFFGPLAVRPDLWDRGIAQLLLEPTMRLFEKWGIRHAGLFTFSSSTKHVNLYQKFGFWPRFLTALMELPISTERASCEWGRFNELTAGQQDDCLKACEEVTNSVYEGLALDREILAVRDQRLGDTLLIWDGSRLAGFAVCHVGAGTEAGSGKCYVKFGAVRCGANASRDFRRLLAACRAFGLSRGANLLVAGVNLARLDAYKEMLNAGFRSTAQGVAMERNGEEGYNRPDVLLMDDWR
jgi:GNAT superfamily N-acetyltransferase